MKNKIVSIRNIYVLILGVFFAFASSLSYLTNYFYYLKNEEPSNIGNILSSLQFWIFLISEILLFIYLRRKVDINKCRKIEKKTFYITLIIFLLALVVLLVSLLVNKKSVSIFEAVMFCLTTFLFHILFIINSKLFKSIFAEERDRK